MPEQFARCHHPARSRVPSPPGRVDDADSRCEIAPRRGRHSPARSARRPLRLRHCPRPRSPRRTSRRVRRPGDRAEAARALGTGEAGDVDLRVEHLLADPLVLDRPVAQNRHPLLMHLVVVERAVVGHDDRAAECGSAPQSRAMSRSSGSRRRRRSPTGRRPSRCSASAAPTEMPGPPPTPPPPSRAQKSSGCAKCQNEPCHDSGSACSVTSRLPTAPRNAWARSSMPMVSFAPPLGSCSGARRACRLGDAGPIGSGQRGSRRRRDRRR